MYSTTVRKDPKAVEKRLLKVCQKLNVTEVNISMFHRMIKEKVATNDVRSFAVAQQLLNRHRKSTALKLSKVAMQQKLHDAYSTVNALRAEKRVLRRELFSDYEFSRSKANRIVKKVLDKAKNCRYQQKKKVKIKFEHCKRKMNLQRDTKENSQLPCEVWDVVRDVNVFNTEVSPEPPAYPMICDKSIKLSKCELAFLKKGPKFMVRQELNETEFLVDLEKMIFKEKYDKLESVLEEGDQESSRDNDNEKSVVDDPKIDAIRRVGCKSKNGV